MKTLAALREAFLGWLLLLRGDTDWPSHFRLSLAGLATALALFYLFAFLALVLASFEVGVPTLYGFIEIMGVQSLWLVALLIGVYGTRFALRSAAPVLPVLVPGIYALIAYLILGTPLSLILGVLLPVLWLGLIYMFFKLGRMAGGWSVGVSAAFAVLSTVLLVGLPMTLYMLATLPVPAA